MRAMCSKRVLVVGGSGYLGQHLLQGFVTVDDMQFDLAFTYHSNYPQQLLNSFSSLRSFQVDLMTGQGLDKISATFGQPHVVINCAAGSTPRACELDPKTAMAVNIPTSLVRWLSEFKDRETLLIHLSSDQVYEGLRSFYNEEDETLPVNVYGKSKLAAEKFVSSNCPNFTILRSSIIYGPQAVSPVPKPLLVQWIDDILSRGNPVEFFNDEFRCPIFVKDVVKIVMALTTKFILDGQYMQMVLNVGGPDRLSRVQMAEAVAACRGYNSSLIKSVSASSGTRRFASPVDISMHIMKLGEVLSIVPMAFSNGVKQTFQMECSS